MKIILDGPDMSSGTKKIEAPEISSGAVVGKVRKSESRKSKRIGKRKEDLYSGETYFFNVTGNTASSKILCRGSVIWKQMYRGGPLMIAIIFMIGNKYHCNDSDCGD